MSKARSYFNDLPSLSQVPSRTSSTSSAQQRAPFRPPRPTGAAPSKGTMASTNGVQKRQSAKKVDKGKATTRSNGRSQASTAAPKRLNKDTTVLSSGQSDSEEASEPVERKGKGNARRQDSIDGSESEDPEERRQDRISTSSASSDDEDLDTTLSTRRTSAKHNPVAAAGATIDDGPPPIPQKLLTRLLYEGFEDKNMRIGREAMGVYGKYIETFVREALARAIFEREDADKAGLEDGFVQVEDLERITPQLVLDF